MLEGTVNPETVIGLFVPMDEVLNVALAVPCTAYVSPFTRPLYAGLPLNVAVVDPSYSLVTPVIPTIVRGAALTVLLTVGTLTVEAPVLVSTTLPAYVPTVLVAANRTRTVVAETVPAI